MKVLDFNEFEKFYDFLEINEALKTITYNERGKITDEMRADVKRQVERCAMQIIGLYPFFNNFIYDARFIYDPPPTRTGQYISTMATDGQNYFFNSYFVNQMTDRQLLFVLCHEIMHISFMHNFRGERHIGNWNHHTARLWNMACDYEINILLVDMNCPASNRKTGGLTAKEVTEDLSGLLDEKYRDVSAESIYNTLIKGSTPPPPQPQKQKPEKQEPQIGDYIRIKKRKGGGYGKVIGKNSDGSFKVEKVSKDEVRKALKN